jgi:hypothetical protein
MMTDRAVFLLLFHNPGTTLLIGLSRREHMIDQHEEIVGDGNDGALFAFCRQAPELAFQITILIGRRGPGALRHRCPEPAVPTGSSTTFVLPGALPIAGTQACPGTEVAGGGKRVYVRANFGQHTDRRVLLDSGHRLNQIECGTEVGSVDLAPNLLV